MSLAVLALLAAMQTPPTFAAGVEAVYVDVFVTDRSGPVTGLVAGDFELRDDGVRRPVELVAVESLPLPTLLVLDTSSSVSGTKLVQLRTACRTLLQRVAPADPVGLVTFGHEITVRVPPTTDHPRLGRTLDSITSGGATALHDAIYAGVLLAPAGAHAMVVLFTDGEDNLSWLTIPELKEVLLSSDVTLQAVGVVPTAATKVQLAPLGLDVLERQASEPTHVRALRQLAEATGGGFWAASAADQLAAAFVAVMDAMRTRYVLRFEPEAARRPGLHTLQVKLTRRHGTVRCRKAYYVRPVGAAGER